MELLDIASKRTLRREEAAAFLHRLGDSLSGHNDIEFERDGVRYTVRVPAEVVLEVELEIDDDESSIEVELSWSA